MSPIQTLRSGAARRVDLLPMTPKEQLHAGRTVRRVAQLLVGLWLYGTAMAMFIRAELGLDPWDVFHYGVQEKLGWSFGTVVIVVGALVLLLWIPLRQWPGLGTVANVFVIGIATDVMLGILETPDALWLRWVLLLGGIVVNGIGGAMYIGSQYGPGPRDGLMTGISRRTGLSIRLVRTSLEVTVLAVGWLLGGIVGFGTVLYAVLIGPAVQAFLPMLTVKVTPPARLALGVPDDSAVDSQGEGQDLVDTRPAQLATRDGERPA
ncbi:YczE/YyaS/YitT family protein [Knoellia sp. CPCC 206435]|uniref:membrane protein YczE n=1 Tax=Knoellia terrae TaxID=3404797 RepID=UPI003B430359